LPVLKILLMYLFVTAMQEGRLIVLAQVSDFGNGCSK
jgi:hypothetical protein